MKIALSVNDEIQVQHRQTGTILGKLIITAVKKTIAKGKLPGELGTHTVKRNLTFPGSGMVEFAGELKDIYVGKLIK